MAQKVTAPTFIVYGPMGCGKTYNRRAIAAQLTGDPEAFVDEWDYRHELHDGKVHLTVPAPVPTQEVVFRDLGVRIVPFKDLNLAAPNGPAFA